MGHNRQYFGHNKHCLARLAPEECCTPMFPTCTDCTVACTAPWCTCQDSLSQDISPDRSVSRVIRGRWRWPCLGSRGHGALSRSHPSERRDRDWLGRSVKVGQFQFSMNFPEIMQYYARMRPGHQRLFDNKSEKLGQSQESSRRPAGRGENYREKENFVFHFYLSVFW